jgi:hypothetical protein
MRRVSFPWKRRWRLTLALLLWCGVMASYIIIYAPAEDRLRETALQGIFLLTGSVAGAYLGFATWDDRHARGVMTRRVERDPIPEPQEEHEN